MPTSGGAGEPTPPVPGALSASRADPTPEDRGGTPFGATLGWYDDLSTPYACARQRYVSDPSHIHTVAPLNTYTFL